MFTQHTHNTTLTLDEPSADEIRRLNDQLRKATSPVPEIGAIFFAGTLACCDLEMQILVLRAAKAFDDFTEDNDPHGEHDCATFEVEDERYMFKIDYYARNPDGTMNDCVGSDDPSDKTVTFRIMTLMSARDY